METGRQLGPRVSISTRTLLIIARSVLEQYNTRHPGKLDYFINLHGSAADLGIIVDTSALSMHCLIPCSDIDHGAAFPILRDFGVDTSDLSLPLHCPVARDDVEHSATVAVQYPMWSEEFSVDTSALSLHCPVLRDDVDHTVAPEVHLPHWRYSQ